MTGIVETNVIDVRAINGNDFETVVAGNFNGTGDIPFGWDMLILAVLSLVNFRIATWCALDNQKAAEYRESHKPPPGEEFDTPP